ncbi:hypothetical protein GCM10012290_17400 [Halolactibacillus alkaliphilus]|uniref:Uncharacterized protein n=2 Tax=Halolactibacillus alkaliphilus TaxID=442899 RepID=A0A511X2C1_9BACI|nr:hypothetical protein HAL01_15600 [Halolactibacillus alkaliphilus]GGN71907.1 hypothetical protein GCM10012290_17400 [Halolactibacillus alkaliphilus]
MNIPQLRINQQFARIGIESNDATVDIKQGPAEIEIQQPNANININTKPGKLTIDQSQAFADLGQYPIGEAIRREANEGLQKVQEGSRRRRRQGDMMMKIENGGDPLKLIAKQNAPRQVRSFNIGFIPSYGSVKIDYQPAEVEVNNQANKPIINTKQTPVSQSYQRGNVDVYLQQKNYIEIDFYNTPFINGGTEIFV